MSLPAEITTIPSGLTFHLTLSIFGNGIYLRDSYRRPFPLGEVMVLV